MHKPLFALFAAAALAVVVVAAEPAKNQRVPAGVMEYDAWKDFPIGSWVTHETTTIDGDKTTTRQETYRLVELKDDAAIVERDDGSNTDAGKSKATLRAPVAEVDKTEEGRTVAHGEEELKIAERTIQSHWCRVTTERPAGKRVWTIWTSPQVPGGVVKQTTSEIQGNNNTQVMTSRLVDYAKGPTP